jgi:hypothetical protein
MSCWILHLECEHWSVHRFQDADSNYLTHLDETLGREALHNLLYGLCFGVLARQLR